MLRSAVQWLPRPLPSPQRQQFLLVVLLLLPALVWRTLAGPHWLADVFLVAGIIGTLLFAWHEWQGLRRVARAYELAMQAAHDGFWEWDPVSKRLQVGRRLLEILGYRDDFFPDTHAWLAIVHPDDRARYNQAVAEHLKGRTQYFYCEYRVRTHDGSFRWIGSRGIAVRDRQGKAYQMVGSVTDITERRRYQENLEFLAHHDSLTGLPNRLELAGELVLRMTAAAREQRQLALYFVDLDRFKDINDTLGHRAGDLLLQGVAQRLESQLAGSSLIFRQGGDEFIVLFPDCPDSRRALALGEELRAAIAQPFAGHGSDYFTSASVGLSLYPDDARDAETLLRNADTAMYAAKSNGGNALRQYQPEMNLRLQQRVDLESGLRQAIALGELELHFQPKVRLADGRLCGAEALLRWRHKGELVPPDRFIPVAEDSGLILDIGDWVIRQCLFHIATWRAAGARVPPIAINLSPRQFWRKQPARDIFAHLAAAALPPTAIEVEVTESLMLQADSGAEEELRSLRAAGIGVALDDFGTGYSSLSYLQSLPINVLKIDRSFIRALTDGEGNERADALVTAIIAMAHSLSLEVVAEGVETTGQQDRLRALGCDIVQGYLHSRPLPAPAFFERFLATTALLPGASGKH